MLKELEVPFEDMPGFLRPTISFDNEEIETILIRRKKYIKKLIISKKKEIK